MPVRSELAAHVLLLAPPPAPPAAPDDRQHLGCEDEAPSLAGANR